MPKPERIFQIFHASKWGNIPLVVAAAFVLGSMACAIPVPIITLPPKDDLATTQLLPSAESGNARDQYRLAMAYRFGIAGVKKDPGKSWGWLGRSASLHYEPAQIDAADAWLFGDYGQSQDVSKGLAAWRELASKGSVDAPFKFAMRLSDKRNAWSNVAEAAKWFEAAARRGHTYAAFKLARLLESGEGVTRNEVMAYAWYEYGRAPEEVTRLEASMSSAQLRAAQEQSRALKREIGP